MIPKVLRLAISWSNIMIISNVVCGDTVHGLIGVLHLKGVGHLNSTEYCIRFFAT